MKNVCPIVLMVLRVKDSSGTTRVKNAMTKDSSDAKCVESVTAKDSSSAKIVKSANVKDSSIVKSATTKDSSGVKSVKSIKLEKSEQGDCQKLLVLCSEFLLEVLEDEVLLGKWMECD